ncbi:MAG: PKD domain-containing protein [Taibaiella sp.]|nr:PKD domain-containing protein [Taibaiella sp.]
MVVPAGLIRGEWYTRLFVPVAVRGLPHFLPLRVPGPQQKEVRPQTVTWGVVKIAFNLGNVIADAEPHPSDIGCPPFEVDFENNSINATDYAWDFDDGATSAEEEPSHTFTSPGVYEVRLIASNENGCIPVDTAYITITVTDSDINADFDYEITDSCEHFTVEFTNTSTSYSGSPFTTSTFVWKFGDGSDDFAGVTPPAHNFPGLGTYTVTLIMYDPDACTSPDSIQKNNCIQYIECSGKF